jgi:hypothetical protein
MLGGLKTGNAVRREHAEKARGGLYRLEKIRSSPIGMMQEKETAGGIILRPVARFAAGIECR